MVKQQQLAMKDTRPLVPSETSPQERGLYGIKGGNVYLPIPYVSVTSPILSGLYP